MRSISIFPKFVCRVAVPLLTLWSILPMGFAQIAREPLLEDLRTLSSDAFAGRATGENEAARAYILTRLGEALPAHEVWVDTFAFSDYQNAQRTGYNVTARVEGTQFPDHCLVISAHYDHLGIRGGEIYNGADDNASGTAALLSLVTYFQQYPPRHTLLFAFFDAEELGLQGARHFVDYPPIPEERILLNINLDMIGRSDDHTINICGVYDFPKLNTVLKKIAPEPPLVLTQKHEGPEYKGSDNWTMASDHGMFRLKEIPYLYFGVEDHAGYHDPSDDYEFITPGFYLQVTQFVQTTIAAFDKKLKTSRLGTTYR